MSVIRPHTPFGEPGGDEYDADAFHAGALRSELIELASGCCFTHASRIIDALLAEFTVTPRRGLGRRYR